MVLYSVHFQKGGSMEPYEPPLNPPLDSVLVHLETDHTEKLDIYSVRRGKL